MAPVRPMEALVLGTMKTDMMMANGSPFELPTFDPVVHRHLLGSSSFVSVLMEEIDTRRIYARLFEGRKNLTFLDIGANVGLVSIYAYDACRRIVAVEPDPQTFVVLKAMVCNLPKIEPFECALTPQDGQVDFFQNDINCTASSTVNTFGRKLTVRGCSLASILSINQLEHVDVCKVDCEGGEGDSLTLPQIQAAKSIVAAWWIETHPCPKSTYTQKLVNLVRSFSAAGYRKAEIDGMKLVVTR